MLAVSAGSFDLLRVQADVTGSINKKKNLYFWPAPAGRTAAALPGTSTAGASRAYGSLKWEIAPRTSWQVNVNYVNDDASNNYQPRVPIYNSRIRTAYSWCLSTSIPVTAAGTKATTINCSP